MAMLCSPVPLRYVCAKVVRNGAGFSLAAPMPATYQLARPFFNFKSPLRVSVREQNFGHSRGNASVAALAWRSIRHAHGRFQVAV